MKKQEIANKLYHGATLSQIFKFQLDNELGLIYKSEQWAEGDDVIYIPDDRLNELSVIGQAEPEEIPNMMDLLYTGNDFVRECNGNRLLARTIFSLCWWQNPCAEVLQHFDDSDPAEMILDCSQTEDGLYNKSGHVYALMGYDGGDSFLITPVDRVLDAADLIRLVWDYDLVFVLKDPHTLKAVDRGAVVQQDGTPVWTLPMQNGVCL